MVHGLVVDCSPALLATLPLRSAVLELEGLEDARAPPALEGLEDVRAPPALDGRPVSLPLDISPVGHDTHPPQW